MTESERPFHRTAICLPVKLAQQIAQPPVTIGYEQVLDWFNSPILLCSALCLSLIHISLGLSSLGRTEPHVLSSLHAVLSILLKLAGGLLNSAIRYADRRKYLV